MEFLRTIKESPKYKISNYGNIFRNNNKLKPKKTTQGYLSVCIPIKGRWKQQRVHRLVAEAFIPNPENKPQVNHKNGIKTDNRVENLEWATASENTKHAFDVLGRKANKPWQNKFGKDNHKSKIVQQIKDGKIIAEFYGAAEAFRKTGINQGHIIDCCNKKRKTAGGYIWKRK